MWSRTIGTQLTNNSVTAFVPGNWRARWPAAPLSAMNPLPCCTVSRYPPVCRPGSTSRGREVPDAPGRPTSRLIAGARTPPIWCISTAPSSPALRAPSSMSGDSVSGIAPSPSLTRRCACACVPGKTSTMSFAGIRAFPVGHGLAGSSSSPTVCPRVSVNQSVDCGWLSSVFRRRRCSPLSRGWIGPPPIGWTSSSPDCGR